jgi:multidrug resistance efflux pump
MRWGITIAVFLGALAGIGARLTWGTEGETTGISEARPATFNLGEVATNGVVEGARPEVGLRPEIAGTIAAIHFRENQEVSKGTVLVELHNAPQKQQVALAQAQLSLEQAQLERLINGERPEKRKALARYVDAKKALYAKAKSDKERADKMNKKGAINAEDYDTARFKELNALADLKQAEAERDLVEAPAREDEVAAAKSRVAAAQAQLRLAQAELDKTYLKAPTTGRILQVYAEPGEMAGPNSSQPILVLADMSRRRVRAFVEELDVSRVKVGQVAMVTADGFPNREFMGKVAVVVPRMGKRSVQSDAPGEYRDVYFREVLIDLQSADDIVLNMRVRTRIVTGPQE